MSQVLFNDGQELIYQDINKLQTFVRREFYERVMFEIIQRTENAFFGDSFKVNYSSPTAVTVNAGSGFQTDNTQVSPESKKRLLYNSASATVNLDPADGTNNRIDIIVVKHARAVTETDTRKFKNASTSVITNELFNVANDWVTEIDFVTGTPSGSPAVPATPSGYIKIAELLVTAVTGLSGSGAVTDTRTLVPLGESITINTTGFDRFTAGAAIPLSQLWSEADTFAKWGYDAIVGTGGTHATLALLVADAQFIAGNIKNILIQSNQTPVSNITIDQDDVKIDFKPGVSIVGGGGATRGLILDGNRIRVLNGRFSGFSTAGHRGVDILGTSNWVMVANCFFSNCDSTIVDAGNNSGLSNNIEEV